MNLTSEQHRIYFESRLAGQRIAATSGNVSVRCLFHADSVASLSVNLAKGVWRCHAGCGGGGILEFEKKFSKCDVSTAWANIAEVCGAKQQSFFHRQPEAIYPYTDEDGVLLGEKLRFRTPDGKTFRWRQKTADGSWKWNRDGVRKVLYRLPEVIRASDVIICEGEKDADRVGALKLSGHPSAPSSRVAVTTSPDGASSGKQSSKWSPEFSPFFTGKHVVIFPDNDPAGKHHALETATSVFAFARDVKIVELPFLEEKGDVSNYLETHSAEDLLQEIHKAPRWKPEKTGLLIDAPEFLSTVSLEIDWLVEGVIQRKANGFIGAAPKVGKSWLAADLVLSLALGLPWVGFNVSGPVKVALITREDNPALTRWRMDRLLAGKGRTRADLQDRLYVNSREQSPVFRVDEPDFLAPMITELRAVKPEFVILDVFNILHGADENDNTEMRGVLEELNRLHREIGCAVGVVHHFSKNSEGSLTQRLRGAGAIAGWAEWLIGVEAEDEHVRKMQFEIKAAERPDPLHFRISGEDYDNWKRIERTDWVPARKRNAVEDLLA
jgi:hypothetical protein